MKKLLLAAAILCGLTASAADFDAVFADSTLRVNYAFANDPARGASIFVENLEATPGWYGRRNHLPELALRGNGAIFVKDAATGDTIYATSFTALFHEWLCTDEAKTTPRSFAYTFLMPLPKQKAVIDLALYDAAQQTIASASHVYDPADILVRRWQGTPAEYVYIHQGGDPKEVIDVAILPEGYTAEEMPLFLEDCQKVVDAIMGHEPFTSSADKFNFIALQLPSEDSNVSIPRFNQWRNTRYDCHYSTLYSDRYMTTPSTVKAHDDLRGVPYEHVVILANTEEYGGGRRASLIPRGSKSGFNAFSGNRGYTEQVKDIRRQNYTQPQ